MKKKLKIDLLKKGVETENLSSIIAENNSGGNPVSLEDIASYLWVRRSIYNSYKTADLFGTFPEDNKDKLLIMEEGKCVAVIEEIEINELVENLTPSL